MDKERRESSRRKSKLQRYSTDSFYGLEFTTSDLSRFDRRQISTIPNFIVSGSDIIIDYSSTNNPGLSPAILFFSFLFSSPFLTPYVVAPAVRRPASGNNGPIVF